MMGRGFSLYVAIILTLCIVSVQCEADNSEAIKRDTETIIQLNVACLSLLCVAVVLIITAGAASWVKASWVKTSKQSQVRDLETGAQEAKAFNVVPQPLDPLKKVKQAWQATPQRQPSDLSTTASDVTPVMEVQARPKPIRDHINQRILLVSDNLPRHELLIRAALPDVVIVPVQYNSWSLQQLQQAIMTRVGAPSKQFASVGILDHGAPGDFCLLGSVAGGSIELQEIKDSAELQEFFKFIASYVQPPKELHKWQTDLDARIDLMGCEIAAGPEGMALINYLEELTQVNWAASTNKTGNGPDQDWVMESDEGLPSIHTCYFDEEKLLHWQHHAGFWDLIGNIALAPVVGAISVVTAAAQGDVAGVALGLGSMVPGPVGQTCSAVSTVRGGYKAHQALREKGDATPVATWGAKTVFKATRGQPW